MTQPARSPGPRPSRRPGAGARAKPALDRDAIAAAALRVIDDVGVTALSMRRVAEELGTGAASLYAHVDSKDGLLDLVFDLVMGEIRIPDPDPDNWHEQVKSVMAQQRRVLASHRDVAGICMARIPTGPNALPMVERTLALMRAGGLPDDIAALAPDLLGLYVTAVTYEETLFDATLSPEDISRYIEDLRAFFAGLSPDEYPNLTAMAGPLTAGGPEGGQPVPDARFAFGLEVILRGLEAVAADRRAAAPGGDQPSSASPASERT